jgi:hypothetical protein
MIDGKPKPGPAKLVLLSPKNGSWHAETIEDPMSNVFHKAMAWREGILTIGGTGALLRHWRRDAQGAWVPKTLWEKSWGGRFDRLRDIEIGNVDGKGGDELVIATHDQGVVAVATEDAGDWSFVELDRLADTFVHEIEIGDVDGDGVQEFYATVSARNKLPGVAQSGGVYRYDFHEGAFKRSLVAFWEDTHAKEILVNDLDGDGKDDLYVAIEARTTKSDGEVKILSPVRIAKYGRDGAMAWTQERFLDFQDSQTRFLTAGDVNGDGNKDLVVSTMKTGLWLVEITKEAMTPTLIDASSGGFEHATILGDIDGDGTLEILVAADREREIRSYRWHNGAFESEFIATIPPRHITWSLALAEL